MTWLIASAAIIGYYAGIAPCARLFYGRLRAWDVRNFLEANSIEGSVMLADKPDNVKENKKLAYGLACIWPVSMVLCLLVIAFAWIPRYAVGSKYRIPAEAKYRRKKAVRQMEEENDIRD